MTHIEDCLLFSLAQKGDKYVFGAEVKGSESDRWDCSELVEGACRTAGLKPVMPDGAYNQWKHCLKHDKDVTVGTGVATRGALLFVGDGTGVGRDAITHVAWSLGDGTTIEARGTKWGVGVWPAAKRFDFAALVPGADYSLRTPLPAAPQPEEDDVPLGNDHLDDQRAEVVNLYVTHLGRYPSDRDRDLWVWELATKGRLHVVDGIATGEEATAYRAKLARDT